MSSLRRAVVGPVIVAAVAAGLVLLSGQAPAQPEGKGAKKGFDGKKGFEKKGFEKKDGGKGGPGFGKKDGPGGDAVRVLESELRKLREMDEDLEAKLHQLRGGQHPGQPHPPGGPGMHGFGMGGPGHMGGGMHGPGGPGMHGFGMWGGMHGGPMGGFGHPNFERMSTDQLRQLIGHLQHVLDQKTREQAPQPRTAERGRETRPESARPGARTEGRTEGRQGPSQDDIMRRLDQLSRELDEIRRAIRK